LSVSVSCCQMGGLAEKEGRILLTSFFLSFSSFWSFFSLSFLSSTHLAFWRRSTWPQPACLPASQPASQPPPLLVSGGGAFGCLGAWVLGCLVLYQFQDGCTGVFFFFLRLEICYGRFMVDL
jgi:hypothetical protein